MTCWVGRMGTISQGAIGNPAYNTCANIVTLCATLRHPPKPSRISSRPLTNRVSARLLGGPEAATAKIHALDPSGGLDDVRVGRYQLTARTDENENIASAASFGRFYKLLVESLMP